ncbi:MAG: hypothetical protein QM496_17370 [Verrucomicrobiota bacterium]
MQRATYFFNEQQRKQVGTAVAEAESMTSCEIVPVAGTVSGAYDRSEDIVGIWLAAVAAVMVWLLYPLQVSEAGSWGGRSVFAGGLLMMLIVFLAFAVGVVLSSRIAWLRLLFTPRKQMQQQVTSRARELFFDQRVHHTSGGTGLLIYVSLFERMAVVFGDQEILDKFGQEFLDKLCHQLTSELQQSHPADAICKVIAEAGKLLSDKLPRADSDVNELQDTLVLLD